MGRDLSSSGERSKSGSEEDIADTDFNFSDAAEERKPYFPNQKDLKDLIRDIGLTNSYAEPLTSRLKEWNLLHESVQVTDQRKHRQHFPHPLIRQDGPCFCNGVASLFKAIGITVTRVNYCLYCL
uniref:Uncharacterized protein n=1 Tax=Micrurus spixii TaxID=129469 RepID=A0A2D4MJ27_9SAUR